jgi:hypothetical protein
MNIGLARLILPRGGGNDRSIDHAPRRVRASADVEANCAFHIQEENGKWD